MSNTNGYGMKKAILYARASTEAQARRGYPFVQQFEALRVHAASESYEIIAEIADAGWSGSSIDRPGMNRAWGTAAQEDVFAVLAVSRDRFSRKVEDLELLIQEFGKHGCRLTALTKRRPTMPSTNGHGTLWAILYARVSTDEQVRHGYSIRQQLERGREWCAENGYEVLAEIVDAGQSGASLERPGHG